MDTGQPATEQVESPARSNNSDALVLHPYLYPHAPLKVPLSKTGMKKSLGKLVTKGGSEKQANGYLNDLEEARHALSTGAAL